MTNNNNNNSNRPSQCRRSLATTRTRRRSRSNSKFGTMPKVAPSSSILSLIVIGVYEWMLQQGRRWHGPRWRVRHMRQLVRHVEGPMLTCSIDRDARSYVPDFLDDPALTVGKHRVVLTLPGMRVRTRSCCSITEAPCWTNRMTSLSRSLVVAGTRNPSFPTCARRSSKRLSTSSSTRNIRTCRRNSR